MNKQKTFFEFDVFNFFKYDNKSAHKHALDEKNQ